MDIRNEIQKITIYGFLLFGYASFSQSENFIFKEMDRYSVDCTLKPELEKILNNLKAEDQKLIFIVNTFVKIDTCQVSLTTDYDVEIEDSWIGFFEYKSKLFLLESLEIDTFFTKVGRDKIKLNIKNNKKSNNIVQPYIDNLPFWLLEYSNEQFTTILSPAVPRLSK